MACDLIKLAVMDEAAAIDSSRPLEQIADGSGVAWGGQRPAHGLQGSDAGPVGVASADARGLRPAGDQAGPEAGAREHA
eukprot:8585715-Alexandrium_andersonii.AAC.1